MRLVDFQVTVRPAGLSMDEQKALNHGFFPVYESARLWLKEQDVTAPFRKIVVSLSDRRASERWHGNVMTAVGVCEVTEAVDVEELLRNRGRHEWTSRRVLDALNHISREAGWRNGELESLIERVSSKKPPCSHHIAALAKHHKDGVLCEVILEADTDTTEVKVRFSSEEQVIGDLVVASRPGPLFLETDFPVTTTRILEGSFVLLAKDKAVLARVPLPLLSHSA